MLRVTDRERAERFHGVEVHVDVSDVWRRDPQRIAQVMPLEL
jgi:hypothetical protein